MHSFSSGGHPNDNTIVREVRKLRTAGRTAVLALIISLALAMTTLFFIRRLLPVEAQPVPPPPYTIGEWEGYVAIFEGDDTYPMQVLDTAVAGLPAEQQAAVRQGVPVTQAEELYLVLEDYTG